jgi:AcrR family transcriptional regulator
MAAEVRLDDGELALPTERRLLLAAERLFAERGIDGVSLRAVMAAAGANVAAVHYHFGSKDELVRALIKERGDQVSTRRTELLDELDAAAEVNVRLLAEAFVRPVVEMVRSGGTAWVTLIAGILNSRHPALSVVSDGFVQQGRRFTALLERIHPDLPARTARFRLTQAMTLTFQVLGDLDGVRGMLAFSGAELTPAEVFDELIDVVTAILAGPPD